MQNINNLSLINLFETSDTLNKAIILFLVIVSVFCWSLIISKSLHLTKTKKLMNNFEKLFWSEQNFQKIYQQVRNKIDNPLALIFINAINEYKNKNQPDSKQEVKMHNIEQAMQLAQMKSIKNLNEHLSILGNIASTSPFIGLLGTVWGIIHSFQSISFAQNITIAVVAPGIAEALLVTAIGLLVAIPSLIFYNYFCSKLEEIENQIDSFIIELNIILSKINI
ncbi:protein TolQ [Rickettsia endosymbiont of Cardiosporidium cionae]|uniref:protein TolQ n=1 Tax=Rickettsia endosymbiont of Cardiosporidium cionae TaxID=2777155 RepID=UPI0018955F52|nr:protein TolQ [Rickettsia endosymbiont of Cardiosporidium cionae]KAF8818410.1 protein TolQ [Rickettsia endosymbiont of Cardiosporidium cionae]